MPLRIAAPDVYETLVKTLGDGHVQPYDVKADAIKKEDGLLLSLSYGEGFKHTKTYFFTYASLKQMDDEVTSFFHGIKEACKKTLISDYLQTMNPLKLKKKKE